MTRQTTASV